MKAVAIFALAGAVMAAPALEERDINPLSASLAILGVLPSSLRSLALVNATAAGEEISSEFLTGTPTWFTQLPTDVQSYFITAGAAGDAVPTAVPSGSNSTATGIFSNSTMTTSGSGSSTITAAATTAAAASSAAASSSSSGGAALPTQAIAGGFAGLVGLAGMLAL